MNDIILINKDFISEQGKRIQIIIKFVGNCRFETKIIINNCMVSENISFTEYLYKDNIIPNIEQIDKINEANSKLIETNLYITNLFKEK